MLERYRQQRAPSNGCGKATFHRMWTTVWKRCALFPVGLWTTFVKRGKLRVGCVETSSTTGLPYFV